MNVLILTPDRVGSTLLQRVLTIYMLRRGFDKPVINLHELTNGLEKYYNSLLNQEVLGKPRGTDWGYFQTLEQITELLKTTDHYKTSRLAHYHLLNRKDSIDSQIKFYEYLNENYFIISCRRKNIFEHAMSWVIQGHSKKLNVYHPFEKIECFEKIYRDGITVSEITFKKYLTKYKEYIDWSDTYFNVQSHFNYEEDANDLESYILGLDFMKGHSQNGWNDMFGQKFTDWNTCHKLLPDLKLKTNASATKQITVNNVQVGIYWDDLKGSDWGEFKLIEDPTTNTELEKSIKNEIVSIVKNLEVQYTTNTTPEIYNYLNKHASDYKNTFDKINGLVTDGFLVSGIPIKLQTLMEKKAIVKNYTECIRWYNEWVDENGMGEKYTEEKLDDIGRLEESTVNNPILRLT